MSQIETRNMQSESNRLSLLLSLMEQDRMDAVILTDACSMRYYTGYCGGTGYVYISNRQQTILTDFRYTEEAEREAQGYQVIDISNGGYGVQLLRLLQADEIHTCGFEADTIRYADYQLIQKQCEPYTKLSDYSKQIQKPRMIKSEDEIRKIKQAEYIGDIAYTHIIDYMKQEIGQLTEADIALELEYTMKKLGAEQLSFDTIVASGENASLPHARVSNRCLASGDFVTMDYGCIYQGYCSDMTRTIGIGKLSTKQREVYKVVLEAQMAALNMIKPGVSCKQVDKVARDIIEHYGYGAYFGHGLGHAVGLYIHEEPRFSPNCDTIVQPNMVITVEPGIYLPGQFGVRIEDLVVITENSYENLTCSSKKLTRIR